VPHSGVGIPALSFGVNHGSWTLYDPALVSRTSLTSSTSITDSLSLAGTDLDTGLLSTLQGLATANSDLDSYLGAWVSSEDLVDHLGADTLYLAVPATGLVVRAGEDPCAWVSIPEGESSSQAIVDLDSSWSLLNDLVHGLKQDAFIPVQSILVYQPDGSSEAVVYISLTDPDSTLSALPLDYPLDSVPCTDIVGVSSDLGLGNKLNTATSPSENSPLDAYLGASTRVGSGTGLLAPHDDLEVTANIGEDGTSDPLTYTSSLGLDTDLADIVSNSFVGVDIASDPETAGPSDCL